MNKILNGRWAQMIGMLGSLSGTGLTTLVLMADLSIYSI